MNKFEICYLAAMCGLIALCFMSQILVSALGSRKSKIAFIVISFGALLICIAVFIMLNVRIDFYPARRLYGIRDTLLANLPAFVLTIVSASEFSGLIHSLNQSALVKTGDVDVDVELNNEKYPLILNERKAGKVIHKDYKIVGKEK